eukprot:424921-Rhodomonas_salina.1
MTDFDPYAVIGQSFSQGRHSECVRQRLSLSASGDVSQWSDFLRAFSPTIPLFWVSDGWRSPHTLPISAVHKLRESKTESTKEASLASDRTRQGGQGADPRAPQLGELWVNCWRALRHLEEQGEHGGKEG